MAKRRKTAANGSNVSKPNGDGLPVFDEKALSALTNKIESGFGNSRASQNPIDAVNQSRKPEKAVNGSTSARSNSKTNAQWHGRGTKRDAQGNSKETGQGSTKNYSRKMTKEKGPSQDDRAMLLQEILALGGTEEDLALVQEVESDEEDIETGTSDAQGHNKEFHKEFANFVAGLGIEGNAGAERGGSDAEDAVDEGWEEVSDIDSPNETGILDNVDSGRKIPEPATSAATKPDASSSKNSNRLIFEARPDWHAAPLPTLPIPEANESTRYREAINNLKDFAISLLQADGDLYSSKHLSSSSSHRFLSTIMSSGTLSDKVSALTLVVQESPVHTTKSFENLLALAKKRSRGQAVTALGALKDLLGVGVVLPADRRLRSFAAQPGLLGTLEDHSISNWRPGQQLPGQITKAHLISWAYEDWLKDSYFDILKVLEGWCNDEVEYARSRAITYVYELLKEKPEQESNLLRLLVNKLGDPDKKIASRTSYLILQLQMTHPLMKSIIVRSIESELLLRPGQSSHAKYYAINTLNQTILSGREEDVARKLLNIYFDLFVALLKKPDIQKALAGPVVNRKGQIQGGGAPMGKKAKLKATKAEEAKQASEETTEKMISAVLSGVNRALPFSKTDDVTLEKHMDTLFRITHSSNFNTSIQALMLIEQLSISKHIAVDRFYKTLYESLLDPRLVTSSKHALYLNLLFSALRSDVNVKRVKAFAKRMLQIITLHQPPFICGVLYLLRELEAIFPGLKSLLTDAQDFDEVDDESYHDVPEDETTSLADLLANNVNHKQIGNATNGIKSYDGRKRDPEHSNADRSCLWESIPFLDHFHPSVSMFASCLIYDQKMPPKPDLASHTLTHFLDRFVYRNAKAAAGLPRGSSIMQPLAGGNSQGVLLSNRAIKGGQQPVNSEAFWRKKLEDVAVDEVFFHKYFNQIGKGKQASRKKDSSKAAEDSDHEDVENEDKIWQALVNSRPEVEGNSEDDSDLEMLDLDDSLAESSVDGKNIERFDEERGESDNSEVRSLDALQEDDAQFDSDSDARSDIDELFEKELQTGQALSSGAADEESRREKRKKLKNLPTFASAEEYAEMLENDEDEDL